MSREEALESVLGGLQELILMAAKGAAGEQYSPRGNPDDSDDAIRERQQEMNRLRRIREEIEEIGTGVLRGAARYWVLEAVTAKRDVAEDWAAHLATKYPAAPTVVRVLA